MNVAKALVQGQAEMAVPGVWTLTGFVPDCDMLNLPVFYGHALDVVHPIIDGKPGAAVNDAPREQAEGQSAWSLARSRLHQLVQHQKTAQHPRRPRRHEAAATPAAPPRPGAPPSSAPFQNTTPCPEVPLALSQGAFDGLATTDESCASASLWDSGVHYALEDHQNVGEYIPMLSGSFWEQLTPDLRTLVVQVWHDNIPAYRQSMADAQARARATMAARGIHVVDVPEAELVETRNRMLPRQDEAAKLFKVRPEVVQLVMSQMGLINLTIPTGRKLQRQNLMNRSFLVLFFKKEHALPSYASRSTRRRV